MSFTLKSTGIAASAEICFVGENGLSDLANAATVSVVGTVSTTTVGGRVVYGDAQNIVGNYLSVVTGAPATVASNQAFAVLFVGHFGNNANDLVTAVEAPGGAAFGSNVGTPPNVRCSYPQAGALAGRPMTGYTHPDAAIRTLIYGRDIGPNRLVNYFDGQRGTELTSFAGLDTFAAGTWRFGGRPTVSSSTGGLGVGIFALFVGIGPQAVADAIAAAGGDAYAALFDVAGDSTPPTQGGSITVGTVTATSIQISWPAGADNVAVATYEVSSNGGTTYTEAGNVLTYTFTGLAASTLYQLRVRAKDGSGNVSTPALAASQSTSAAGATVSSPPLRNNTGTLLAGTAIAKTAVLRLSDLTLAATFAGISTSGAGVLALTNGALVPGTDYLVLLSNADGAALGVFKATAA